MGNHSVQHYKDAAQQLPVDMLKEDFSINGLSEAEVREIQIKSLFKENSDLLGMASGSNMLNPRGVALADQQRKTQQEKAKRQKEASHTFIYLLGQLNDAMAPIEAGLAEKYGENYHEQIAEKYLSESEFDELSKIKDLEDRKNAMREALSRRHEAGDIDIQEGDIKHWLDTYDDKVNELGIQRDRLLGGGEVQKDDSLKAVFAAKTSSNAPVEEPEKTIDELSNDPGVEQTIEASALDSFMS